MIHHGVSLAALVLSIASLCTALIGGSSTVISTTLTIDVILYLFCYFVRLQPMSRSCRTLIVGIAIAAGHRGWGLGRRHLQRVSLWPTWLA